MFAPRIAKSALLVLAALSMSGCGETKDPQQVYADALELYNAESDALARLEQQRQNLQAQHDKLVAEIVGRHQQAALSGQLGDVANDLLGGLGNLTAGDEPLTEDNVLDRLDGVEGIDPSTILQRAQDVDAALNTLPDEAKQEIEQAKQALDEKLAPLDAEIAAQQQRVDKARAAKDTAEAALNG